MISVLPHIIGLSCLIIISVIGIAMFSHQHGNIKGYDEGYDHAKQIYKEEKHSFKVYKGDGVVPRNFRIEEKIKENKESN